MAPKSDNTEAIVLNYVNEQNRPLNSQNVADALQKYNLKKAGIQKALDSLADNGKISFKEYGKQKIYIARQDQFDIPNSEELNQMKEENAKLQEQLEEQRKAISKLEGVKFDPGTDSRERSPIGKGVEEMFLEKLSQWRKRKRMLRDIWDPIMENSPKNLKEFKEELGIEYDEDVGVSLQSFSDLLQRGKKPKGGR
ncbi:hypothetical protein CUMW_101300 [Citrus unshiu]|nr:hypothetical protein CUMW_101300 [Citrus unshiu]